jgi:hypothetical protein
MIVLRIETEKGDGCYTSYPKNGHNAQYAHDNGECPLDFRFHPSPPEDARLFPQWRKICGYCDGGAHPTISRLQSRFGFLTVGQMHRWFYTEESREILAQAHKVSVYLVPDEYVAEGDAQCVYEKTKAKLLGRFPCNLSAEDALVRVQAFQRREDRAAVARLASTDIVASLAA